MNEFASIEISLNEMLFLIVLMFLKSSKMVKQYLP